MMEIGSRRALGDPEHATDLRVFESFHIVQHDHRSLTLA
jgi:hypothetical protein